MAVRALQAGELRHRVKLQSRSVSRTASGGFTLAWADARTIWAKIEPIGGSEGIFADATRALASHIITTRAQTADPTALGNRLTFGSRVFNIIEVRKIQEIKHEYKFAVTEVVSATAGSGGVAVDLQITPFETDEIDFLTTQDITITIPSGKRFYVDTFEAICTKLTGVIIAQPTVRCGIGGNLTKYRNSLTSQLTAINKRQTYGSLSANDGETGIHLGVSVAASGPSIYKGALLVKGILV